MRQSATQATEADFHTAIDGLTFVPASSEAPGLKMACATRMFQSRTLTSSRLRTELEAACKRIVEAAGLKIGDLIHPIRVAITGKTVGPGLYDCLAILGREQSLARLTRALPLCG